ncbi:MAG TPA: endo-1,4-beta-xylanase [Candidatus Dormibacteraeota bacterium]|nr:endo-1,4-beta-xylanase [Candidatus Dormibacteraeota bacterium]
MVERQKGSYNFRDVDNNYHEYAQHGIVDFHAEIGPYFPPGGEYSFANTLPGWAQSLDFHSLEGNMSKYVHALVSHFKGQIQFYHLWTEANAWYGNDNWPIERIIEIIKMEATTIRSIDPNAKICIDLVNITPDVLALENKVGSSNWTTEDFAERLMAAGVPFDVIGLETHYGTGPASQAGGIDTLYSRLIELGRLGKPIYVWEDGLNLSSTLSIKVR